MEIIGVIVLIVILLTTTMQISFVWIYGHAMNRAYHRVWATQKKLAPLAIREMQLGLTGSANGPSNLPEEVAVVLCLRGADPSLVGCLRGIVNQSRKPFQLHIVVDDQHDPAVEIVERHLPPPGGNAGFTYHVHLLPQIPQKCSLKSAALLTAIDKIPHHIDKIAFLDADTIPDKNWLHDLLRPLPLSIPLSIPTGNDCCSTSDTCAEISLAPLETFGWRASNPSGGSIGATTGNRWFDPPTPSMGGYLRQIWNAAAVVQMALYNVAWGGSFALNRKTLQDASLEDRWATAFCEDTMLAGQLKKNGIHLFRVPELVVINREDTGIRDACRWIVRQLLTVRLYHRGWPLVALHGLSTGVVSLIAPLIAVISWFSDLEFLAVVMGACWLLYQVLNAWLLRCITNWNQSLITTRGIARTTRSEDRAAQKVDDAMDRPDSLTSSAPVTYFMAMLLAQYVQPIACIVAMFSRRVHWRGVEYKIGSRGAVELTSYRPLRAMLNTGTTETKDGLSKSDATDQQSIT